MSFQDSKNSDGPNLSDQSSKCQKAAKNASGQQNSQNLSSLQNFKDASCQHGVHKPMLSLENCPEKFKCEDLEANGQNANDVFLTSIANDVTQSFGAEFFENNETCGAKCISQQAL